MADRPILFSGPMVRALLAGTKTQTRRILKPQPEQFPIDDKGTLCEVGVIHVEGDALPRIHHGRVITAQKLKCAVGDRLWVKETWRPFSIAMSPWDIEVVYAADGESRTIKDGEFGENDWNFPKAAARGNVSSLFMTRWASRLTLTVTDVRVERVQDCSEDDALAEGMTQATAEAILSTDELQVYATTHILAPEARGRILYETIWDQINGDGSWASNPWVAAYTFTVERGNIDQLASKANG